MKKKLIVLSLCLLLVCILAVPILIGCTPRDQILRIYNCEDYISTGEDSDVDVLEGFKEYYKSITGKKIKIKYETFDVNETMLQKVVNGSDYDIICTSDYMLEKMQKDNLLVEKSADLGKDVNGNAIEDYRGNVSSFYKDGIKEFDPSYKYSVGYMYGTMGICYNPSFFSAEDLKDENGNGHPDFLESWGAIFDPKYSAYQSKSMMKKSIRDTIGIASIYALRGANSPAPQPSIADALNATDDASLSLVKSVLTTQKANLLGYETDEGKQSAVDGNLAMLFQWAGDAYWAIEEAAEKGVALDYIAPTVEGNNVFFDGWAIPKNSKNQTAAQLWLNYMCNEDVALANMEYVGYTSVIDTQGVVDYLNETFADFDPIDLSYIFGEKGVSVRANEIQYPTLATIQKCAVMKDYGSNQKKMTNLWSEIMA